MKNVQEEKLKQELRQLSAEVRRYNLLLGQWLYIFRQSLILAKKKTKIGIAERKTLRLLEEQIESVTGKPLDAPDDAVEELYEKIVENRWDDTTK